MNKLTLAFLLLVLTAVLSVASLQAAPPADEGVIIHYGDTVEGDLTFNEQDNWLFEGDAGQRVVVSLEKYPPDPYTFFDPYLTLIGPDGSPMAEDDNRGVGTDALLIGYPLPTGGRYTIQVRAVNPGVEGTYRLSLNADTLPAECESWEGEVVVTEWQSAISGENLRYRVYLPPCHQFFERRYPYIILMHGSNTDDTHWDRLGIDDALMRGVALERYPPMALVMPWGGTQANTNVFGENASYEYMILNELMPAVERDFCLWNAPEGRAIGGISRGGFWAYEIGLRHPDLFSAIGGHSPFFDLYHAPDSHNPLALALSVSWPEENAPRLYIDRGKQDYAQLNIDRMVERLTQNQVPHVFDYFEVGEHRDSYWQAHLDDYLSFYSEAWTEIGLDQYPPCEG